MIGSVVSFWIIGNHLFRRADYGNWYRKIVQQLVDAWKYRRIGNVPAIPRQQVLYPMMRDDGDMQCVGASLWRKNGPIHDLIGNLGNLRIQG